VSKDRLPAERRAEIAALLALGMDPATLAAAAGVEVAELAGIARGAKEHSAKRRAAAKRGQDARGAIAAAAAYLRAASADPWAPVPAGAAPVVRRRVEIDPGLAGLDRHVLVAFAAARKDQVTGGLFQAGVEDAWTSGSALAGRYVVPAGSEWTEGWNKEVSWGRVWCHVDVTVEAMSQSVNPSSLLLLKGAMDWDLWRLRAEHVVRHPDVIERFDSYKSRASIASSPRGTPGDAARAAGRELAARLIGGKAVPDEGLALECHRRHAWAPFVSFDPAWRDEWLDRLVLVLYDPPAHDPFELDAFANMFPVATLYTGGCKVWYGAGKTRARLAAVVDALVPKGNIAVMVDRVLAVATAITPEIAAMPECSTLAIPYPAGYPAGDITRVYGHGGRRASAVLENRVATFEEHWDMQRSINEQGR